MTEENDEPQLGPVGGVDKELMKLMSLKANKAPSLS